MYEKLQHLQLCDCFYRSIADKVPPHIATYVWADIMKEMNESTRVTRKNSQNECHKASGDDELVALNCLIESSARNTI